MENKEKLADDSKLDKSKIKKIDLEELKKQLVKVRKVSIVEKNDK